MSEYLTPKGKFLNRLLNHLIVEGQRYPEVSTYLGKNNEGKRMYIYCVNSDSCLIYHTDPDDKYQEDDHFLEGDIEKTFSWLDRILGKVVVMSDEYLAIEERSKK